MTKKIFLQKKISNFLWLVKQQSILFLLFLVVACCLPTQTIAQCAGVPNVPMYVKASKNRCDNKILITWQFYGSADRFRLYDVTNVSYNVWPYDASAGGILLNDSINVNDRSAIITNSYSPGVMRRYGIFAQCTAGGQFNSGLGYYYTDASYGGSPPLGLAIPSSTLLAVVNSNAHQINLSWVVDTSSSGYQWIASYTITRTDEFGIVKTTEIPVESTSYTDQYFENCVNYTYKLKVNAGCDINNTSSNSVIASTIPSNLNNTFDNSTNALSASKGYFQDKVQLTWSNQNNSQLDGIKIYRKDLTTTLDSILVGFVNPGTDFFSDNTAESSVLYRYTLVGFKNCRGNYIYTNTSSSVGFRVRKALVSGHIEYTGGIALQNAKVTANSSSSSTANKSLYFAPGVSASWLNSESYNLGNKLTMQFWLNPLNYGTGTTTYISKYTNFFSFYHSGTDFTFALHSVNYNYLSIADSNIPTNQWTHVSLVYAGDSMVTYINGVKKGILNITPADANVTPNNLTPFQIGGSGNFNDFKIDEFRYYTSTISPAIIADTYNRPIYGDEPNLKVYLGFDEGVENNIYDGSFIGTSPNKNNFQLNSGAIINWTTDVPSASQMGYYALTNNLGNYTIKGIKIFGAGDNYALVPQYLTHTFSPSSRQVFISDGSSVHNNQDFEDNSSFIVTGQVLYSNCTCPVVGANLKVDGLLAVKNGGPVSTNASGQFTLSVPIGQHYIDLDYFGHTLENGRFPATGTFDFQNNVSGIQFTDSTKRSIVGRVVGGLIETDKAPGMGRSKNNLGQAKVRIVSPIAGIPCYAANVISDSLTGEYRFDVPPIQYRIDSTYILKNKNILSAHIVPSPFTNTNHLLDLRNIVSKTTVIDTLKDQLGGIVNIKSIDYHLRNDMTYRSIADINIKDTLGRIFVGEDTVQTGNVRVNIRPTGNGWGAFGFPVFQQNHTYAAEISAFEAYSNFDNGNKDTVLLNGTVSISNNLVNGTDPNNALTLKNGKVIYRFICGSPNIASNPVVPKLSYTKDLQISVVPNGASTVMWQPNGGNMPSYPNYHAYVIGKNATGTGVATEGPQSVDFILRDPPGSGSSASWVAGQAVTNTENFSFGLETDINVSILGFLGVKGVTGLGFCGQTDAQAFVGVGLGVHASIDLGGNFVESITSSYGVSTGSDINNVGSNGDVFVGRSVNWYVGPSQNIELRDLANCAITGKCFGDTVNGMRLANMPSFAISKGETKTRFSYTQSEIEKVVIPGLEAIRKSLLTGNSKYTSYLPVTDPYFGANNDNPHFIASTSTQNIYELADTTGQSYTFRGKRKLVQDSVRIINTQISLWKQALAQNEKEKLECKNNLIYPTANQTITTPAFLDNFTLGSAVVTNSYETDKENTFTFNYELALTASASVLAHVDVMGNGADVGSSISVKASHNFGHTNTVANSASLAYTLTDGDPGDIMSVDVYKTGTGNVFITRGGQTMCPYEDAMACHYFNPQFPNAIINSHTYSQLPLAIIANATVKREVPNITITPNVQYNIPSGQGASFQLTCSNQSALSVNNNVPFRIYIPAAGNPNGAGPTIDGQGIDYHFTIPTGTSVVKNLVINRGPIEINYDSIMVVLASECSNAIADTIYVSVHFIPTCTDVQMTSPNNNWVYNNSVNNTGNVIVTGYDYNYGAATNNSTIPPTILGLNNIDIEFRPSSSNTWLQLNSFYKHPTTGQDTLPNGQVYTQYLWDISSIPDGNYELKSKSSCLNKDGSFSTIESPAFAGVMDRINPHPFGTPSPGDGILDPNDDISIQFNEPIDLGSISPSNFDVRGVINGGNIRHSESLLFDGATSNVEVAGGASIQKRDFTFELWAKVNTTGIDQTMISQGVDAVQNMSFGLDATNKLVFKLGSQSVTSCAPVSTPAQWHHYACSYNYTNQIVELFVDGALFQNASLISEYTGSGKVVFGKLVPSNTNYFSGYMHDLRLWNTTRNSSNIYLNFLKDLNRTSIGLLYNWKMNEAEGNVAHDFIRSRNGNINGAIWSVLPVGNAAGFDGIDDAIEITSGTIPITKEMDFTLEFWFKSNQAGVATLFSNGKGDGINADSLVAWNIQKDASGQIHVYHRGLNFIASNNNYFDNNWHHFALVLERSSNLSSYIDGNLENSVQSGSFAQMAGATMHLGALGYATGATYNYANYFNGSMDEFRFWNIARKAEQIKRDKQNRMQGDEIGLQAFLPFENYVVTLGVPILTPTFNNQSQNTLSVTAQNGTTLIATTPTIKLPRPVQAVNFTYSVNNDKIIITPSTSPELIENVTLDITVKSIYDLHGNIMQSPKTWIAYINKNQVKWQDDEFNFEKIVDSLITFTAPIINTGGALKAFTIGGLPTWMTANVTNGTIAPNSVQNIVFTIPAGQNIGDYNAGVTVTTDFNYGEVLLINLKVKGVTPTWSVNPSNFQYSMNVFGQFKIDNIIAINPESKIAAFNHGVICGVANLQYVPAYDKYEAFLNIYSNTNTGDSIKFNIYDASSGITFVNVTPSLLFVENDVQGTVSNPIMFVANTEIARNIPLNAGWTWFSLPLKSAKLANSNLLMSSVSASNGDVVRSNTLFDQYDSGLNWLGGISQGSGYSNNLSYKVKLANIDTLVHIGSRLNPDSAQATINVVQGWNWIGFVADKNLAISEAMGNYNAQTGDLLKSQYQFAYYDNLTGWTGSLTFMKPAMGYMLKSSGASTFNYPLSGFSARLSNSGEVANTTQSIFPFTPEQYANTMSAIITGNICGEALDQGNVAIGAFDNTNTLRGYAYPIKNSAANKYNFYLTAYSNINSEVLNIKYFNTTNGTVLSTDKNVTFATDGLVGTPANPITAIVADSVACKVVLNTTAVNELDNATNISVYPNPFNDNIIVHFNNAVTCNVELVDMLGKVVYASSIKNKKEYNMALDANKNSISVGMYYIRLTGDINQQIKVVKTK